MDDKIITKLFNNIILLYKDKEKWESKKKLAQIYITKIFNINLMVKNYTKFWKSYS